jgi:hypothetical protein
MLKSGKTFGAYGVPNWVTSIRIRCPLCGWPRHARTTAGFVRAGTHRTPSIRERAPPASNSGLSTRCPFLHALVAAFRLVYALTLDCSKWNSDLWASFRCRDSCGASRSASARHRRPEQPLRRRRPRMVVERSGALVEAASVPRIAKPVLLVIEVVAQFMAECAQKRPEGGDLLAHDRPHPDTDQHRVGGVVSEKFGGPVAFVDAQRPSCEDSDSGPRNSVEVCCRCQKLGASMADDCTRPVVHGRLDGFPSLRRRSSCGSSMVLRRSLSRNPAR